MSVEWSQITSWNFRVMRHIQLDNVTGRMTSWLAIHEVYYPNLKSDDLGLTTDDIGYTDQPVTMTAVSIDELRFMLAKMLSSLDKPILDYQAPES